MEREREREESGGRRVRRLGTRLRVRVRAPIMAMRGYVPSERLCSAVREGDCQEIRRLIDKGLDPNNCIGESNETPLESCCLDGNLLVAKYLIEEHFYDPHRPFPSPVYDETPLYTAVHFGHFDLVKYLIDTCHCDPMYNTSSRETTTALHKACQGHKAESWIL